MCSAYAFGSVSVVLVLAWAGGPLADPDVWWHVRTGDLVLAERSVPHTDPWSFTAPPDGWVPTAWLSDVLFALVHRLGGTEGLRVLRLVLAAAAVVATWLLARRCATTARDAALATGLGVLALAPFLRERPQVLSFLFVAWLALALQRVLAGDLPRFWTWVPVCWLWANVHGMWVLLPVALLGAGVLAWSEDRSRVPLAARCTLVALLSWAAVLLTPAGPRLAWWPLHVRDAAAPITEWQPTVLTGLVGAPLLVALAVVAVRWSRSAERVPRGRVAYVLAAGLFGLLAFRNVGPAVLLLVPELARPLGSPPRAQPGTVPRLGVAALALGLALGGLRIATSDDVSSDQPVSLVARLAQRDAEVRLLNHYDVGGLVTGTAPRVRVAIDGRTDLWSPSFVRHYLDALNGAGDWRLLVDELRPTAALLPDGSEVARGLVIERAWRVTDTDGRWQLLEPSP